MPPLNLKPETNWRDNAAASQRNREAYLDSINPEKILEKMNKNLPLTPDEQAFITEYTKNQPVQQPRDVQRLENLQQLANTNQLGMQTPEQKVALTNPTQPSPPMGADPANQMAADGGKLQMGGPKIETDPDGKTNYTFTEELLGQLLMDTSKYAIMAQQMQAQSQANYGHNVLTPEQLQGTKQAAPPDDLIEKLKALK